MIRKIANWYADGGKILLLEIAYIVMIVYTILVALGGLVTPIVLIADDGIDVGVGILMILGDGIVTLLNLVLCGLVKGEALWTQNVTDKAILAYSKTNAIENKIQHTSKETKSEVKPETKKTVLPIKHNESGLNKSVTFIANYFGSDSNGNHIKVSSGTVGTIVKINANSSLNIEYDEDGEKITVIEVMPHNVR